MRIINDMKLDFDDVLICPKRSDVGSRADVNLNRKFKMKHPKISVFENNSGRQEPLEMWGVPIIASNMDTVGTFAMAGAMFQEDMFTCLHKFYSEAELIEFYNKDNLLIQDSVFYTMGITDKDFDKLKSVKQSVYIKHVCLDVANGYTKFFVDKVRKVRELLPQAVIMAGNVCTGDMTQELLVNGADIIKIGIGPGKVCETRKVTGVGFPQLSAIIECADVAHGVNGHICADGGCSTSGDIAKAFGGGADFVMLGGMLAGHDECEGEWLYESELKTVGIHPYTAVKVEENKDKKKSLKFYGMSSREAMEKHYGGVASHRAPEGKCIEVPYKGPVSKTLEEIMGGLRSACTYIGTDDIKHLSKCTTFVRKVR